jgi:hypothetical protein
MRFRRSVSTMLPSEEKESEAQGHPRRNPSADQQQDARSLRPGIENAAPASV